MQKYDQNTGLKNHTNITRDALKSVEMIRKYIQNHVKIVRGILHSFFV